MQLLRFATSPTVERWIVGLSEERALSDTLADSLPVGTGVCFRLAQPSLTDHRNICQNGYIYIYSGLLCEV